METVKLNPSEGYEYMIFSNLNAEIRIIPGLPGKTLFVNFYRTAMVGTSSLNTLTNKVALLFAFSNRRILLSYCKGLENTQAARNLTQALSANTDVERVHVNFTTSYLSDYTDVMYGQSKEEISGPVEMFRAMFVDASETNYTPPTDHKNFISYDVSDPLTAVDIAINGGKQENGKNDIVNSFQFFKDVQSLYDQYNETCVYTAVKIKPRFIGEGVVIKLTHQPQNNLTEDDTTALVTLKDPNSGQLVKIFVQDDEYTEAAFKCTDNKLRFFCIHLGIAEFEIKDLEVEVFSDH
jgi:hypothetical protein